MPVLRSHSKVLAIPAGYLVLAAGILAAVPILTSGMALAQERVNPHGAAVKAFLERAQAYVDLQKKEDDGLPKIAPRDNTSQNEVHQRALAARMRLARPNAKPGEIFGDLGPPIKEVILKDAQSRAPKDKKALMEEVPPRDPPKVNAEYPEKAALATVPPLLLDQLPRLPEGLEYRFMGRDLILRDTKANLIADFLNEAVPMVKR